MSTLSTLVDAVSDAIEAIKVDSVPVFATVSTTLPAQDPDPSDQPAVYITPTSASSAHSDAGEPIWIQQIDLYIFVRSEACPIDLTMTAVDRIIVAINAIDWTTVSGITDHVHWLDPRTVQYERGHVITEQQGLAVITLEALIAP
jgi:hypothetical protein